MSGSSVHALQIEGSLRVPGLSPADRRSSPNPLGLKAGSPSPARSALLLLLRMDGAQEGEQRASRTPKPLLSPQGSVRLTLRAGRRRGREARTCSTSSSASRARGGPEAPELAGKARQLFPRDAGPPGAGRGGALGLAGCALPALPSGAPARRHRPASPATGPCQHPEQGLHPSFLGGQPRERSGLGRGLGGWPRG